VEPNSDCKPTGCWNAVFPRYDGESTLFLGSLLGVQGEMNREDTNFTGENTGSSNELYERASCLYHQLRRHAMPTDLIVYILICLLATGFIKRVGEVFSAYEMQPADSTSKKTAR
jgi:hypothetical protein